MLPPAAGGIAALDKVEDETSEEELKRDRMFIKWQPPKGENDDYDNENFWISGWLPSRRRKEKGRRREKD